MSVKTVPFSDELIQNIAAKYGTPFHIYDEKGMLDNVKRFQKAFSWNPNFHEYFAVKATPNPWIMKSLKTLDVGSDCSSMAELVLAESVGIKGEEIVFSANDTPDEEFIKAHELGAIINLDDVSNLDDLERLQIVPERICFRYNPGPELTRGNAIIGTPEEAKYGMTYDQLMTCVDWAKKKGISYSALEEKILVGGEIIHARLGEHGWNLGNGKDLIAETGEMFNHLNHSGSLARTRSTRQYNLLNLIHISSKYFSFLLIDVLSGASYFRVQR